SGTCSRGPRACRRSALGSPSRCPSSAAAADRRAYESRAPRTPATPRDRQSRCESPRAGAGCDRSRNGRRESRNRSRGRRAARRASRCDVLLTAQPLQYDRDLLLGRIVPARLGLVLPALCPAGTFIFAPGGYDEPEILRSETPSICL